MDIYNFNLPPRCLPVPQDNVCAIKFNFTSYARKVSRSNADVSDALRNVVLRKQQSSIIQFCNESLDLAICFYQFPPCQDFKLLPVCSESCKIFLSNIERCLVIINPLTDTILIDHFKNFSCDDLNYYNGYNQMSFSSTDCYSSLPAPLPEDGKGNCVIYNLCIFVYDMYHWASTG